MSEWLSYLFFLLLRLVFRSLAVSINMDVFGVRFMCGGAANKNILQCVVAYSALLSSFGIFFSLFAIFLTICFVFLLLFLLFILLLPLLLFL